MSDSFKCKCSKCGIEKEYYTDTHIQKNKSTLQTGLVKAFMDGWNWGKNALCWDCQPDDEVAVKPTETFKNEPHITYDLAHTD